MKKILLLFASLTLTSQLWAQDPELLANTWYIYNIEVDGVFYNTTFSGDTPVDATLNFHTNEFNTRTEDCSDTFGSEIVYDVPQQQFTLDGYAYLLAFCTDLVRPEFNAAYFGMIDNNMGGPITFDYEIFINGDTKKLVVTNAEGDIAVYSNMLHTAPDPNLLEQEWYLSSLEEDLGYSYPVSNISPPISPTITIAPDLSFISIGACNTATGIFINDVYGSWVIKNAESTNNTCEFQSHTNFDSGLSAYLSNEMEYSPAIDYNSDPLKLFFFSPSGFGLIYQDTPLLSVDDNRLASVQLYPNPVAETLFISSEGDELEAVSVYDMNGSRLLHISENVRQIDMSQFSSGLYFVEMHSDGNRSIQKFIKN